MNMEEAADWLDRMGKERAIQIVHEHYHLKQHLCAQRLGVPTGTVDWVSRAIERAEHLRECETQLHILIDEGTAALTKARWKIRKEQCTNCRGSGRVEGNECCICRGTGAHAF